MIPKFEAIKRAISDEIEQGRWQEHEQVPSENALAQRFACSRMTARRALTELVEQGVLVRSQGLGTFVAPFKSQGSMMAIRNIAEEIAERGHQHSAQLLLLKPVAAETEVAIALAVPAGSTIYRSSLLHLENGQPVQLEDRYVNPALVPDYLDQPFTSQTPHEYLSQVAPLTQAHHLVEAVAPNDTQQTLLKLAGAEPCLQICRRTWSSQGVVSYARLLHPGSRFRLGGHLMVESTSR
ncbi:transcriptional regulator, histidine utilization repressor, GntR family [Ferrimonas balearica DSM 9799]|uniref:Histidine utilization repressor n=1 Tax=Ferrimonas balearica (strain DSM 9799 / CCM 4581 / KCTC 23876 / PAT) TaxID=550540 RepID=E1SR37_FERBD|nr:histidine utilization repressor [Ferrimonas balearica]ADN77967.1 transcriptional regulator, histidine utilization repressor, GntR family [Ferrimonas balearica DSM 9799]MBY5982100.1 histidine utilization repressor [Ferrimonas balearica]MBY6019488.1 histidine utilization repressor [Halomonas denitrificans]MBY6096553.1 histidine utilization repressor [Ferrimonas balearica]